MGREYIDPATRKSALRAGVQETAPALSENADNPAVPGPPLTPPQGGQPMAGTARKGGPEAGGPWEALPLDVV